MCGLPALPRSTLQSATLQPPRWRHDACGFCGYSEGDVCRTTPMATNWRAEGAEDTRDVQRHLITSAPALWVPIMSNVVGVDAAVFAAMSGAALPRGARQSAAFSQRDVAH